MYNVSAMIATNMSTWIMHTTAEVTAQDLLYAPQFDCMFNKFNIITQKITRVIGVQHSF